MISLLVVFFSGSASHLLLLLPLITTIALRFARLNASFFYFPLFFIISTLSLRRSLRIALPTERTGTELKRKKLIHWFLGIFPQLCGGFDGCLEVLRDFRIQFSSRKRKKKVFFCLLSLLNRMLLLWLSPENILSPHPGLLSLLLRPTDFFVISPYHSSLLQRFCRNSFCFCIDNNSLPETWIPHWSPTECVAV